MKNFIMEVLECYHWSALINLGIIKSKTTGLCNNVLQYEKHNTPQEVFLTKKLNLNLIKPVDLAITLLKMRGKKRTF